MTEDEVLAAAVEAWPKAVADLLADEREVETRDAQGNPATRKSHPTDPPEGYFPRTRHDPRPGPIPELVTLAEVATGARTERHEHGVALDGLDVAAHVKHMAHVVVVEARRLRAKGLGLEPPRVVRGQLVLETVNVLGPG